jgi:hypothetical protein
MRLSALDVIGQERKILANRREMESAGLWSKLINGVLQPRNPKHTFTFYTPQYLFIRSVSFCEDVAAEIEGRFDPGDLARVLYMDFLEYVKKHNDPHLLYKQLNARDLSPATIKPYSTDEVYKGVNFEEMRGFEPVQTRLDHRQALKGEFLLRDMLEIYQDHHFTLESILEIVYCNFVDDYRKGIIKKPIDKIVQYVL